MIHSYELVKSYCLVWQNLIIHHPKESLYLIQIFYIHVTFISSCYSGAVGAYNTMGDNIATLWPYLASWDFQGFQLSENSKWRPSVAIYRLYIHKVCKHYVYTAHFHKGCALNKLTKLTFSLVSHAFLLKFSKFNCHMAIFELSHAHNSLFLTNSKWSVANLKAHSCI